MNPAGIHFRGTAKVDLGGLLATTGNISDKNFLAGNYHFEDNSGLIGAVTNAGKINAAEHGFVAFMGPHVENTGHITAHLDQVALYSTTKFTLKFGHNGLVHFAVDDHVLKEGVRDNKFIANNGHVFVPSSTAKSVLDKAIHVPEHDEARSAHVQDGKIILSAQVETPKKSHSASSSSSITATETERPQPAMSNQSDFKIINNAEHALSPHDDADWEVIDSPRSVLATDDNDWLTINPLNPSTAIANQSPRSVDESGEARWMAVDPLSQSITYADQEAEQSPRSLALDLLATRLLEMPIDEMASYLAQN